VLEEKSQQGDYTMNTNMRHWRDTWRQEWSEVWSQTCEKFPPQANNREAFELLAAALIYHFNAVEALLDESLHMPAARFRDEDPESFKRRFDGLFDRSRYPRFSIDEERDSANYCYGTMHLASTSFRLSTALYLIVRTVNMPLRQYLRTDKKGDYVDWDRGKDKLYKFLIDTDKVGCSSDFKIDSDPQLHPLYLAMVLAHRDEFGHGELGVGDRDWVKDREKYYRKFLNCGLVTAQLNLIKIGISKVEKHIP
jgi:hypothetical protein